ncbi:MAG: hypothetical protein F6K26_33415 [Moorea sp. SIO2I5]|nr:hypothetical protein [Moorena sp. SIO2I5]
MGCQKSITTLLINKKGDYVLGLKANHKKLYKQVKNWFEQGEQNGFSGVEYSEYKQFESGNHRIEKREVWSFKGDKGVEEQC